ncbi:DUF6702 family protein [Nonlabens tegetincola]|uniref:DUF6702 family protein n=1 Tax=Nonlabens tegetincola TaxID=323273 RepID=UPI0030C7A6BD
MKYLILIVTSSLMLFTLSRKHTNQNDHKYYLSVSNVAYKQKASALQMTSRFFIDDMEDALQDRFGKEVKLDGIKDLKTVNFYLEKYFQSKIEATVDGKELTVNVLGAEFIDDQIVLYIELPVTKMPETIKMKFTALFEVFDDQKNMVHYKINDKRKSMVMTKERPQETLTFS